MLKERSGGTSLRVPVEHRFLGLDKRSFPYALFVIAVFIIATVIVPRINEAIAWNDPVRAGEQFALSDNVLFTPSSGWNVESGFRVGPDGNPTAETGSAVLINGGATFIVEVGKFDGSPAELLTQVEKVTISTSDPSFSTASDPATITTRSGEVGVSQSYNSINGDGRIAAFVLDGTGVKVTAYGSTAQLHTQSGVVDDMIASIRLRESDGGQR